MDAFERVLGPRPQLTLDIELGFVTAIWVAGRRPDVTIRDFDLGASATDASLDTFGAPFVPIHWSLPPWRLRLALAPQSLFPF
ncbi:MAG: hypothetical protein CVT79_18660 [Alphaproteobacteria bacterium HGW-Alphaproteobacteria-18]|nr:MAG: hypothetical protein CVT79_18660 [Alphaproteobacteria bacterium HGW-Alphaproteobacteria-18]